MLPSMPILMTPIKELADDSSCSSDDSPTHHSIENGHTERHISSPYSISTLGNSIDASGNGAVSSQEGDKIREKSHSPEKRTSSEPTSAQKKKKKNQHRKMLTALTPDSEATREASAQNFAEAYFQKVRNRLDDEKWALFVQELITFEEQSEADRRPVELYRRMEDLFGPHTDLVDEFLGFLLPHQALEANRLMAYLSLHKMTEFFRKLNILLMKRQVRLVQRVLESLTVKQNVTLSEVKEAILPLLKSSSLLTNLFLELLPGERPPDSLMTDFEQVDVKDDSECETVVVPDCPDPYGSENCVCQCHQAQSRHCVACGIKYLNGRVYIQYGKALRPAKVIFKEKKHLDLLKWEEEQCRNRRRFIPKTMLSPGSFDHRLNADSEDDCGVKKSPRTPRIRVTRPKVCKKHQSEHKEEEVLEGIFPLAESKNADNNTDELVESEMKNDGIDEHDFDEIVLENECNTEEDEEEYLNKGLHSENESSIEAEDIAKELECSFEDEEVDDFENSEIDLSENLTNHKDEDMIKTSYNVNHCENSEKSTGVEAECPEELQEFQRSPDAIIERLSSNTINESNTNDLKVEPMSVNSFHEVEDISNTNDLKVEPMSVNSFHEVEDISNTNDLKVEPMSVNSSHEVEDIVKCGTNSHCVIKTEVEEIMDVDEPCADKLQTLLEVPGASGSNEVDTSSKEWTREEDKIILQTFQHENGLEQTFETASLQLPNRSKEEIQGRFEVLMKLLKEMISDESNSNP